MCFKFGILFLFIGKYILFIWSKVVLLYWFGSDVFVGMVEGRRVEGLFIIYELIFVLNVDDCFLYINMFDKY